VILKGSYAKKPHSQAANENSESRERVGVALETFRRQRVYALYRDGCADKHGFGKTPFVRLAHDGERYVVVNPDRGVKDAEAGGCGKQQYVQCGILRNMIV